jgi:hypothetical protein
MGSFMVDEGGEDKQFNGFGDRPGDIQIDVEIGEIAYCVLWLGIWEGKVVKSRLNSVLQFNSAVILWYLYSWLKRTRGPR